MIRTGYVCTVQRHRGRLALPIARSETHDIGPRATVELEPDGDALVVRRVYDGCVFCGSRKWLVPVGDMGRQACAACCREAARR